MKKVLVITYYWPPSGGAGVQRILKTAKYIREFGWEPIIFTARDAAYPIFDESLQKDVHPDQEVLRGDIWEPYELYKQFTGKKKQKNVYSGFVSDKKKPSFTENLSIWIRGNFFIPDARCFWIKPSITFLTRYLKDKPVDAIFSTGPPHTTHMIAKGVKLKTGIPWLADFRDPWTNIDFYDQLMLTQWADRRHRKMEQSALKHADVLTTVSWTWGKEFEVLGAKNVKVITNGFDDADFHFEKPALEEKFVCSHIGFLNRDRNAHTLWKACAELSKQYPDFKEKLVLRFIGKTDPNVFRELKELGLETNIDEVAYLPHSEVLPYLSKSQVLLLLINNVPNVMGVIPGKIYEYMGSHRPILAIGKPEADFAKILAETGAGVVCDFEDLEKMKQELLRYFERYQEGSLSVAPSGIEKYTRKALAGKIARELSLLTE